MGQAMGVHMYGGVGVGARLLPFANSPTEILRNYVMLTSTLWLALLQLAERFLIRPFSQYVSRNNVELFDYFR